MKDVDRRSIDLLDMDRSCSKVSSVNWVRVIGYGYLITSGTESSIQKKISDMAKYIILF